MNNIQVGSIVRCKRRLDDSSTGKSLGRAVVATVAEDENENMSKTAAASATSVCLLWEPYWPKPINPCTVKDFFITPKRIEKESEQEESTVPIQDIQDLLPFEQESSEEVSSSVSIITWKDRGDILLRLGDASAAASFYEKALLQSSRISIGSTIIVSIQGFPKIAEIDCIEDDIDITIVETGEEQSVKQYAILLGIMESDPDNLQERILLNLARCMLQISELDSVNRNKYLKAGVLATTLVITVSSHRQEKDNEAKASTTVISSNNAQTALILRVKAQMGLSKWPQATQDARKLVQAGNDQGAKLLSSIERKKKLQVNTNKKLAKEMCRLVQSSTSGNTTANPVSFSADATPSETLTSSTSPCSDTSLSFQNLHQPRKESMAQSIFLFPLSLVCGTFIFLIVPLIASVLMQHYFPQQLGVQNPQKK